MTRSSSRSGGRPRGRQASVARARSAARKVLLFPSVSSDGMPGPATLFRGRPRQGGLMPQHTASPIEPLDDGGLRLALSRREMTTPLDPYQGLYVRGQPDGASLRVAPRRPRSMREVAWVAVILVATLSPGCGRDAPSTEELGATVHNETPSPSTSVAAAISSETPTTNETSTPPTPTRRPTPSARTSTWTR